MTDGLINLSLGAIYLGGGRCRFRVWSPMSAQVEVHILTPEDRVIPMERREKGYFQVVADSIQPGMLYVYRLDGQKERPDPASRSQPQGVHGPSEIVDPSFNWTDECWLGISLPNYIIYELHVGTFTPEGTFDAVIPCLDKLKELGITAIEIMPIAQFPGERNWGYDGVHMFAAQYSYGGVHGLKRLVNACHERGLAVVLDVVYNHLGAEGNYLWDYGPYFTDLYKTLWGSSLNYDGAYSDEVRRFFIENALYWIEECGIDALRLDATDAILDFSVGTFLEALAIEVKAHMQRTNRRVFLIAESDRNDARLTQVAESGGYGLDAQWVDNFHHALRTFMTQDRSHYYEDYGDFSKIVTAYRQGFVFTGQYSEHRKRRHGSSPDGLPSYRFVVCGQNHDQVGNRMLGERLHEHLTFDGYKLVAATVLLSPFVPLLFMGEDYMEPAPFQYFIHHGDDALVEAVRQGRTREFAGFQREGESVPDPQAEETFLRSKLNQHLRAEGKHRIIFEFYKALIHLRKTISALSQLSRRHMEVVGFEREYVLFVRRWSARDQVVLLYNYSDQARTLELPFPMGRWDKIFDSSDAQWCEEGSPTPEPTPEWLEVMQETEFTLPPFSVMLYHREID